MILGGFSLSEGMMHNILRSVLISVGLMLTVSGRAETSDERFRSLLVTAGYSTLIGAMFGAAILPFTDKPMNNTPYIFRGAAIGFLGGALVGSFLIFSPLFIEDDPVFSNSYLDRIPEPTTAIVTISPLISYSDWRLRGIVSRWTIYRF